MADLTAAERKRRQRERERKEEHDRERDAAAEAGARAASAGMRHGDIDPEGRVKRAIAYAKWYEEECVPERDRYEAAQAEQRKLRSELARHAAAVKA
jgi:hypothetical protein